MSDERGSYRAEGRSEPRRETRLPFASAEYRAPTKDEFRSLTQTLGLTGSMVGALLGVTSRAVRKWIGGENEVRYSAWRLLLIHAGLALEDPGRGEQQRAMSDHYPACSYLHGDHECDCRWPEIADLQSRLDERTNVAAAANATIDDMQREYAKERQELTFRLHSALKFADYIAKRYEEGWDEPITERFYNEAKTLLVETGEPKSEMGIVGPVQVFDPYGILDKSGDKEPWPQ